MIVDRILKGGSALGLGGGSVLEASALGDGLALEASARRQKDGSALQGERGGR